LGRPSSPQQDEVVVECKSAKNTLLVRVRGDLTLSTAEHFEATLRQAIKGRKLDIILELGGVRFIDSRGLRSLLRVANECRGAGRRLRLRRVSAPVWRAIEWGGLQRQLRLVA
jgi:anti-anti-sigma factor